jgi:two-component system response regulator HydG
MTTAYTPTTSVAQTMAPTEAQTFLNLLIVDEDRFVREACREAAQSLGYLAKATDSTDQAFWLVESENIDVVFLAACGGFVSVVQRLKEKRPAIEVIAMTNNGTLRFAVDAMKAGAYDVIAKPFGLAEVKRLLQEVGSHLRTKTESRLECEKHRSARGFGNMIGHSPKMELLYRMIGKAARTNHPVLITGESGTGKEMVAKALHYSGLTGKRLSFRSIADHWFPR